MANANKEMAQMAQGETPIYDKIITTGRAVIATVILARIIFMVVAV